MTDIKGYTPLSSLQKGQMNNLKIMEERVLRMIEGATDADPRWTAIAITDMQKAFMSANRAIAQPQRLHTLPEEEPEQPAHDHQDR
jgi:uncharacterized protein YifE (UPF0438 family)